MFGQGEVVEISTSTQVFRGVFIKEEKDFLVVKLSNGYNIGIAKRNIKGKKSLGMVRREENTMKKLKEHTRGKALPLISILHTGGTIASKVDYSTGAVIARFTPEDIIGLFPELRSMASIRSRLISNMLSENMRFSHYNLLGRAVEEEVRRGVRGVIITHGTDTLHYSAAALSFMLENIPVPVVLVGSQRSSDRPSTDSAVNLISAVIFVLNARAGGVFVCMHESMNDSSCLVVEGVNARKMHTSRRDAFRPINKGLVARVDYENKRVEWLKDLEKSRGEFNIKLFKESIRVGLLKAHPNLLMSELECFKHFDGLIIEGTGLGHIGISETDKLTKENKRIGELLAGLARRIPVVMTSQTIYGRINMNVYSTGRDLLRMGVLGNYTDMTSETAFIKLAWLLSNYKKEEVRELFERNLRGEISDRTEKEYFLV